MPWRPADPPGWLERLNAHGPAVGGADQLVSLDADELLAAARKSTGLDDFGPDTWRRHYDVLVESLQREAGLPVVGRIMARTELLRALRQRLLLADAWKADPSILQRDIVAPVFVVGTGRSGTSIMHELLALDPRHRTPATWELLHPGDACSAQGLGPDVARAVGHQVHAFWADAQPAYESMHHNDGDEPNECIMATMLEFLSDQWGGTYEIPTYSTHLVSVDHTDAYRYHRRVLQSLPHRAGADRWVLKAPSHLGQLRTLFAVYPDARVVQIHRDPLKTVPSTISLMGTIRSMRCTEVDVDSLVALVSFGYGLMLDAVIEGRAAGTLPDGQFVDVRYADLMRDPVATLGTVYEELSVGFDDSLATAIRAHLAARPKDRHGPHRYTLEDTGLDVARERDRFRRYQQHYGVPDE